MVVYHVVSRIARQRVLLWGMFLVELGSRFFLEDMIGVQKLLRYIS